MKRVMYGTAKIEMNDLPEANPGQRFAAAHVRDTTLAPQIAWSMAHEALLRRVPIAG